MNPKRIEECGCCEVGIPPTPEEIKNRPGLAEINYRIGTYSSFRQAMIETIARSPELADWTARQSDDYGIAMMEMWAYLADILTFYQERIANEAFLRTALQRDTIMRLAAMLDYKLNPGVAATADLAFFLEDSAKVNIPVGLRVQSVPGQDEKPQKFETVVAIATDVLLNQVRVFPEPEPYNALEETSTQGVLHPSFAEVLAAELAPTDKLVVYLTGSNGVEEKQVKAIDTIDTRTVLNWSPAIQATVGGVHMSKWSRKFRLFGSNAPANYMDATVVSGSLICSTGTTLFNVPAGSTLNLDSLYDDLTAGTQILIFNSNSATGFTLLTRVNAVGQVGDTRGPLSSMVTQITLENPFISEITDLREVAIYELVDPEITFLGHVYPDTISGNTVYVPLNQLSGLEVDRILILDDEEEEPQTVTVTRADPAGTVDHLAITFNPALTRELDTRTARLYGNIVEATHGETVSNELLGNGDASIEFQNFTLKKSPSTFVPEPDAPRGAKNTLEVRVGGVLWNEEESLYGQGPNDQVYTTRVNDDGEMSVRFGDSKTGARLLTGQDNVEAKYRQGLGSEGNVRANSLIMLLDRLIGLKSVTNSKQAEGGTDPESMQEARANAPNTVRTFDRAISLRDYEDFARSYTGIAKAKATMIHNGEIEIIQLTIAGENGESIEKESKTYKSFVNNLKLHRDINHIVEVCPHSPRPLELEAILQVDPAYLPENVISAAREAVLSYFDFNNLQFGQAIHESDIYAVLQIVEGVTASVIRYLHYDTASPALNAHLRIEPNEIATLADSELSISSDLT